MTHTPDPSRAVYDLYARVYDRIFGRVFQASREDVVRNLETRPGERILEVGVGTGLCLPLYPRGARVTGIDLSEGMLGQARERVERDGLEGVRLLVMDAGRMSFADDAFDLVLAAYVVTAVTDHRRVMAEIVRVTRPGGRILLLNHFVQDAGVVAAVERAISPLCRRVGFRTDLSVSDVVGPWPLSTARETRMPPLGMWRFVELVNEKDAEAERDPAQGAERIPA